MGSIVTLDLEFLGQPQVVASYLLRHRRGGALIDCGPGSTIPTLERALQVHGLTVADVTDVLLTHIHLDHAGAAGWLAERGARVHVHPRGAAHLLNPEKLLASATRIYGDRMESLWGSFLPVPPDRLSVPQDGEEIRIEELRLTPVDTPGHAEHHYTYVFDDTCFCGDVGGIRLPGPPHLRIPMPPPEFHLEKWRESVRRLRQLGCSCVAAAHFGIYMDARAHLDSLALALDEIGQFLARVMPAGPSVAELNDQFLAWSVERSRRAGLTEAQLADYEAANPSWMSGAGMHRYWARFRSTPVSPPGDSDQVPARAAQEADRTAVGQQNGDPR